MSADPGTITAHATNKSPIHYGSDTIGSSRLSSASS